MASFLDIRLLSLQVGLPSYPLNLLKLKQWNSLTV